MLLSVHELEISYEGGSLLMPWVRSLKAHPNVCSDNDPYSQSYSYQCLSFEGTCHPSFFSHKIQYSTRSSIECPSVTGRTKERIAQSKRARAGSLATVD